MHPINLDGFSGYYADSQGRVYQLRGSGWVPAAISGGRYMLHSPPPTRACRSLTPDKALELSGQMDPQALTDYAAVAAKLEGVDLESAEADEIRDELDPLWAKLHPRQYDAAGEALARYTSRDVDDDHDHDALEPDRDGPDCEPDAGPE